MFKRCIAISLNYSMSEGKYAEMRSSDSPRGYSDREEDKFDEDRKEDDLGINERVYTV
jgi:hypothetical protein